MDISKLNIRVVNIRKPIDVRADMTVSDVPKGAVVRPRWREDLKHLMGQMVTFKSFRKVDTLRLESVEGRMNGGKAVFRRHDGSALSVNVWSIAWAAVV